MHREHRVKGDGRSRSLLAAALAMTALAGGCAWRSYETARETREALRECEALHGEGAPACETLRAQGRSDYERYEDESRTAWGCRNAEPGERCPIERE